MYLSYKQVFTSVYKPFILTIFICVFHHKGYEIIHQHERERERESTLRYYFRHSNMLHPE